MHLTLQVLRHSPQESQRPGSISARTGVLAMSSATPICTPAISSQQQRLPQIFEWLIATGLRRVGLSLKAAAPSQWRPGVLAPGLPGVGQLWTLARSVWTAGSMLFAVTDGPELDGVATTLDSQRR